MRGSGRLSPQSETKGRNSRKVHSRLYGPPWREHLLSPCLRNEHRSRVRGTVSVEWPVEGTFSGEGRRNRKTIVDNLTLRILGIRFSERRERSSKFCLEVLTRVFFVISLFSFYCLTLPPSLSSFPLLIIPTPNSSNPFYYYYHHLPTNSFYVFSFV